MQKQVLFLICLFFISGQMQGGSKSTKYSPSLSAQKKSHTVSTFDAKPIPIIGTLAAQNVCATRPSTSRSVSRNIVILSTPRSKNYWAKKMDEHLEDQKRKKSAGTTQVGKNTPDPIQISQASKGSGNSNNVSHNSKLHADKQELAQGCLRNAALEENNPHAAPKSDSDKRKKSEQEDVETIHLQTVIPSQADTTPAMQPIALQHNGNQTSVATQPVVLQLVPSQLQNQQNMQPVNLQQNKTSAVVKSANNDCCVIC